MIGVVSSNARLLDSSGVCPLMAAPPPTTPDSRAMRPPPRPPSNEGPVSGDTLCSTCSMDRSRASYVRDVPYSSTAWIKANVAAPVCAVPDSAAVSAATWASRDAAIWTAQPPAVPFHPEGARE